MVKSKLKVGCVTVATLACIVFLLLYQAYTSPLFDKYIEVPAVFLPHFSRSHLSKYKAINCQADEETTFTKRYIYLIQTDICIPDHLYGKEVFGDSLACNCDVLVLGFKQPCKDASLYSSHVRHLFNSSTTWTTGRELLYNTSILSGNKYMYYIFMDDDVSLELLDSYTGGNPWRVFEDFLYRVRPPIAASDTEEWKFVDRLLRFRSGNADCMQELSEYVPAIFYDGMFNAFHHEAVKSVLLPIFPYWSRFDNVSWWYSQSYVCFMADLVYRYQSVHPVEIIGRNPQHKPYMKAFETNWIINAIIADVEKTVPRKLQEETRTLIEEWRSHSSHYRLRQSGYYSFCVFPSEPPSCIKPYQHLSA